MRTWYMFTLRAASLSFTEPKCSLQSSQQQIQLPVQRQMNVSAFSHPVIILPHYSKIPFHML